MNRTLSRQMRIYARSFKHAIHFPDFFGEMLSRFRLNTLAGRICPLTHSVAVTSGTGCRGLFGGDTSKIQMITNPTT
jgi:hypothetical protein